MRKALWTLLAVLVVLLIWAESVAAQGTSFTGTVIRPGAVIAGASVRICSEGATGTPCSPLAAVYSDRALTVPIAGSTLVADARGNYSYFGAPNCYQEQVSAAGFSTVSQIICKAQRPDSPSTWTAQQTFSQQIVSTVATGTAPFSVASQTLVPNLNVQFLGGFAAPASAILGLTDTQAPTNKTFDVTLNTLKQATPTAGRYLRDNGTSFQPSSVAAAGAGSCGANLFVTATVDNATPNCTQPAFSNLSGTAGTSQIGTGTPAASKYVDGATGAWTALPTSTGLSTASNCSVAGNFPACGSAQAGSVSMVVGNTSNTVQTTAVTANSQILVFRDDSLGTKLGITCGTTTTGELKVTARAAGTSFTFSIGTAPVTNADCFSYVIVN